MQEGLILQETIVSVPGSSVFTVITSDSAAAFWARAAINKGNPSLVGAISPQFSNRWLVSPSQLKQEWHSGKKYAQYVEHCQETTGKCILWESHSISNPSSVTDIHVILAKPLVSLCQSFLILNNIRLIDLLRRLNQIFHVKCKEQCLAYYRLSIIFIVVYMNYSSTIGYYQKLFIPLRCQNSSNHLNFTNQNTWISKPKLVSL